MVEIALGTALAAIGAGVAIGFAGLGSGLGQGMAAAGSVDAVQKITICLQGVLFSPHYQKLRLFTGSWLQSYY